jgi:hypothetical protein
LQPRTDNDGKISMDWKHGKVERITWRSHWNDARVLRRQFVCR